MWGFEGGGVAAVRRRAPRWSRPRVGGRGRMLRRRRERPEREERRDEENEAHESGCGLPNHCTILPSHLARRRRRASSAT